MRLAVTGIAYRLPVMATKRSAGYRCTACATTAQKWVGRCEACGGWGTVEEVGAGGGGREGAFGPARPIAEVNEVTRRPLTSGSKELDRVTAGGLVPGSVTLLAGEPGVGKSTLALQLASCAAGMGRRALYVSAEESVGQVRARAVRLRAMPKELWLAGGHDVTAIAGEASRLGAELLVVDSVQTVAVPDVGAAPGTVTQVREAALRLAEVARNEDCAVVLIGHVTKDGSLAGPRQLEHLVDTVLSFEGDRHHALRHLRAVKHRFGPTSELGLFEMVQGGLVDVPDASGLLLADRRPGAAGSVVFPMLDGRRPLLVELQSLVVPGPGSNGRRSCEGVDGGRLALVLAVLGRLLDLPVLGAEVWCSAAGGVSVDDPGADLALACAVLSSLSTRSLRPDVVVCGEIGLGGEVRAVRQLERRLSEARRAGFTRAVVPASSPDVPGMELVKVATVAEALLAAGLPGPARAVRRARGGPPTAPVDEDAPGDGQVAVLR